MSLDHMGPMDFTWRRIWRVVKDRGIFVWFKVRLGKGRKKDHEKFRKIKEERMRKFPFLAFIIFLLAWPAEAGYKLALPTEYNPYIVGARDLHNGAWMTGSSVEVLWLVRGDDKKRSIVYLAVNNLYELHNKALGSLGATLGAHTGKLGETLDNLARVVMPSQARRLKWLSTISNWASVEVGGGYRAFGPQPPGSRWYYTIGGKVKIPIGKLWSR